MSLRRGQAMVEYLLVAVSLILVVGLLWGLIESAKRSAIRSENLVSSEYP